MARQDKIRPGAVWHYLLSREALAWSVGTGSSMNPWIHTRFWSMLSVPANARLTSPSPHSNPINICKVFTSVSALSLYSLHGARDSDEQVLSSLLEVATLLRLKNIHPCLNSIA